MKRWKWLGLILVILSALMSLGGRQAPQQCTRIRIPETTNLPVVIQGQRTLPPTSVSAAFKPVLSVVELPEGYRAVGGGDQYVIACTP